jgi:hypothetical protein
LFLFYFFVHAPTQVAGLLAAAFGLSSGMFTLIYAVFFSETDNVAGYILFTAIVVALAVIVAVLVMRPVRPSSQ